MAAVSLAWVCLGDEQSAPSLSNLTSALATIPTCALTCLANYIAKENCTATDPQCICVDKYAAIQNRAKPCIIEACSLPEALFTKNVTEVACNRPVRDKSGRYDAMNLAMGVITALLVTTRLVYKKFFGYRRELGPDDWVILWTLILGVPCTILNSVGLIANGLGRDVWTVTPDELTKFIMFFFVLQIFYLALMCLIKLSLSLFYLYIFPGTTVHRLLVATCVFNAVFGVAFVLTGMFSCTPISHYWTQYVNPEISGRCINLNLFAWVHAAFNIATDLWMLALPLSQIKSLDLSWKKKFGVIFMFLIGAFVTIVSVLRLESLLVFANSTNPTWENWIVAWWSTIEVNVGMICTCLPTVRLILVRVAPRMFSTDMSNGQSYETHGMRDRYVRNSHVMRRKQIDIEHEHEPGRW